MLHPAAAAAIGDLHAVQKDWSLAIVEYTKLITAETTDATALAKRAAAYAATEQWDLAQADWMRAILQQPNLAQTAFERLKQAGRWSEAAKFGLMLVEQQPDDSLVWLGIAPVLVLAGDEADYTDARRLIHLRMHRDRQLLLIRLRSQFAYRVFCGEPANSQEKH